MVFVVQWPKAEIFLPEHHTDLVFAQTLYSVKDTIKVIPVSVEWDRSLNLSQKVKLLAVPWHIIQKEAEDRGAYLFRACRKGTESQNIRQLL